MGYRCDLCHKGRLISKKNRHKKGVAGGQWKHRAPKTRKVSLPNLHSYKGVLKEVKGKWRLCTKCLRRVKKQALEKEAAAKKSEKKPAKAPVGSLPKTA